MRKMLPLLVVGILVLSGLGAFALRSGEEFKLKTTSVSFSKPILETEKEYVSVNIAETNAVIMEEGKPKLPSYVQTFTFPFGTKIKSVTCTPSNIQTQTISKDLKPTPKAVIVGQAVSTSQESVNYGTEPYPSNWFEYDVGCGRYKGDLSIIVEIAFSPIKYHPAEKIVEWAEKANIEIEYEPPSEQSMVREEYELLIIAPNEFLNELTPLESYKNSKGVATKLVGLNEVYGGTGDDNQEKIKIYIKDAMENWGISNVLLVGSSSKLPVRKTHVYINEEHNPEKFASDLYYADIYDGDNNFCSWNSNENTRYGEYKWKDGGTTYTDDVDLHPDVYLGRLACRNTGEVTTCVNKIKNYELGVAYEQNWFKNLVVIGGDSFPGDDDDANEGEFVNQHVIDIMGPDFDPNKLWASEGDLSGSNPTGATRISSAINAGCGFVDFSGHGNTNVWATHPHGNEHVWLPTPLDAYHNIAHVMLLLNGDKLPIVTVEACSTAKFNSDADCFNWAFMLNSNGGAIGTFGSTALGWGYTGEDVIEGLIGKIGLDMFRAYAEDGAITFGEMWAWGLEQYIKPYGMNNMDYKTVEEWQPFGDPTLQIAPESGAPNTPAAPNGPATGGPGNEYTYYASTTDPEGDDISYMFSWGDNTYSGWIGPVGSGEQVEAKNTWNSQGTYEVRVLAKDEHGKVSAWSDPLSVTMPRNRAVNINSLLLNFLEKHPNIFPILRYILGL